MCPDFYNFSGRSARGAFESAVLISPCAILDFYSQHSVHSEPGRRMDGMAFCLFRNMNRLMYEMSMKERAHLAILILEL